MPIEPFEPDHARYHHAGCCDAHVAVAARCVVILSAISLGFRMFLQSHPSSCGWAQAVCVSNLESVIFEVLCVVLLHGAVSKEHGPLVFPFVVSQILNIIHIIKTSVFQLTEKPLSFEERVEAFNSGRFDLLDTRNPKTRVFEGSERPLSFYERIEAIKSGHIELVDTRNKKRALLLTSIGRLVWIGIIIYFIFIVLNYFLFLKRRAEAYQAHATRASQPTSTPASNARQTILDYQLSQAPRHPQPPPPAQIPTVPPYYPVTQDHMFEPPPPYQP